MKNKNTGHSKQEELRRQIKKLLKTRASIEKIARLVGVSTRTVYRVKRGRTYRKRGSGRRSSLGLREKLRVRNAVESIP